MSGTMAETAPSRGAARDPATARIAVVGAGLIGRSHASHAAARARLAAIVDPADAAAGFADEMQVRRFASLRELLAGETVDAVVIATPNQLHEEQASLCIEAGLPVLVEKPIADTVAAAERIVAASEKAGVPVLVGHHRRHNPIVGAVRETIRSGALGRLVGVHTTCWFHKPDAYFAAAWRSQPGAGPVYINLIHDIDLLLHYCGEVESVQAAESNAVRGLAVEDTAAVLLRFRSGALGTVTVSDAIAAPWSWELTAAENPAYPHLPVTSTMLGGTRASLSVPDMVLWTHEGAADWKNPMTRRTIAFAPADPLDLQMRHFSRVALGLEAPLVTAGEALAALKVIEAIKKAAETQRPVFLT